MLPAPATLLLWCSALVAGGVPEDGAVAPSGTWCGPAGAPSGSGACATPALAQDPRPAWQHEARGVIAGEPLVWGSTVLLDARVSRYEHALVLVDLDDGRELAVTPVRTTLDLVPCLWDDVVAVRPSLERIELLRSTGERLRPLRSLVTREATPPVLLREELYYGDGAELVRQDLDRREPRWRTAVDGVLRGRPRLAGEHVFALWYDRDGGARLASFERESGRPVDSVPIGHHRGPQGNGGAAIPEAVATPELAVLEHEVFVRLTLPVEADVAGSFTTVRVARRGGRLGEAAGGASLHAFESAPAAHGEGWIVLDATGPGRRWLASIAEGARTRSVVLADEDDHPELLGCASPPARAAEAFYLDDLAVDAEDLRILWRSGHHPRLRPVPAAGTLLVVEDERRLVALRAPTPPASAAEEQARQLVRRHEAELGQGLAGLALRAVRSDARELALELVAEARRRGAGDRALQSAEQALDAAERGATRSGSGAGPGAREDPNRPDAARERREAPLRAERARLVALFRERLLQAARGPLARPLLEQLVAEAPDDEAAREAVRALLPAGAPVVEPLDARSWLEFLAVQGQTTVRFESPAPARTGARESAALPRDASGPAVLTREASAWRADLVGFTTDRLFLVTPPSRPGAAARCLEVGERVCDALEALFGGRSPTDAGELVLLLYETEQEYVAQSQREGSKPELARGWSGGHYSPDEGLSRMFMPSSDERYERLLGVYQHELTHHWLATRAPFAGGGWRARADRAGYWIAEGFATMVEEWRYLPVERRFDPLDPRAESLDLVANAPADVLLPWDELLGLSQEAFHGLDAEPTLRVPLTWRLGARGRVSPIRVFYAQAGATCHWLCNAEDGRYRPALLRAIEAWSAGRRLDVEALTGLAPDELGRRVTAFARDTVRSR